MIEAIYRLLGRLGYGHPIHPPLAHLPIGLVFGALAFFAVALVFRRERLELSARHVSILALAAAFPTVLAGVFDWIHFYHAALLPVIEWKMALAGALLVLLGAGVILGGEARARSPAMATIYLLSFAAVVALGALGGSLVYGKVAAAAVPPPTIGVSQGAPASPAAHTGTGGDGETLFADNCASCHPGGGNLIDAKLPIKGSKVMGSFDQFERFVRAPSMPGGKEGQMPAFDSNTLGDESLEAIYAYALKAYAK